MPGRTMMFKMDEIFLLLWRRKLLIATVAGMTAIVFLAGSFAVTPLYRSEASVVVRLEGGQVPDPERSFNSEAISDAAITTEKEVLSADGLLSRVADSVLFPPGAESSLMGTVMNTVTGWLGWTQPDTDRIRAARRLNVIVHAVKYGSNPKSSVINISATTFDPQFSADIVNAITKIYLADRLAAQSSVARNAITQLRERLSETQLEIATTETGVSKMLQRPDLLQQSTIPNTMQELALVGQRLETLKADLAARRSAYDEGLKTVKEANGDSVRLMELLDQGGNTTANLRQQLLKSQSEMAVLLGYGYKPTQPNVVAVDREIQQEKIAIGAEADSIIRQRQQALATSEQTTNAVQQQYDNLQERLSKTSASSLVLTREQDNLNSLRIIANSIKEKIITLAAQPVDPAARVISMGVVPLRSVFPDKFLFTVTGLLLGGMSSMLLLIWRNQSETNRLSPVDEAQYLLGPFLGSLPVLGRSSMASLSASWTAAMNGVAIQIEKVMEKQNLKVITVTSGWADEGKTTVASILAATLAECDKRVLLVNCDLHRPYEGPLTRLNTIINARDDATVGTVRVHESGAHVLEFTANKGMSPLQFLRSNEFRRTIAAARSKYDVVLCDTPPVLAVPDTILVAKQSDAVLLVAEHGRTEQAEAAEITRRIDGTPVCGIVVTKAKGLSASFTSYAGYDIPTRRLLGAR
jgi:succinoglycan biosynthesis transport protein ExoP